LDRRQTRLEKAFSSWNVLIEQTPLAGEELLLSVKVDVTTRTVYVTRNLLVHAWEAYEAGNVIRSRETRRWVPELVAAIDLTLTSDPDTLQRQVEQGLFLAVIGTSRLPITSVESPLPAYALGHLGYFPFGAKAGPAPVTDPMDLLRHGLAADFSSLQQAKLLECVLRAAGKDEVATLAAHLQAGWTRTGRPVEALPSLFRTLFNHVALSPYTGFADNLAALPGHLAAPDYLGPAAVIDLYSYFLRHLARHLTAFDLVTFHHLGANYPDALLLDTLLKTYVEMMSLHPALFLDYPGDEGPLGSAKQLRRRALRQAWLLRTKYEGHPVPDTPTSPGENLRVLPEPYARVPDEQIQQSGRRRKRLFPGEPSDQLLTEPAKKVLRQSIEDLDRPAELRELGMAVYLDRPLGVFKPVGALDKTPLISYESFSRNMAFSRLDDLVRWGVLPADGWLQALKENLRQASPRGIPVGELPLHEGRGNVVALEDARRSCGDFVFLRTTRSSLQGLLSQYDLTPLRDHALETGEWLTAARDVLLIRSPRSRIGVAPVPLLTAFDADMQPRIEFGLGQNDQGPVAYRESGGVEYLEHGLCVLRVWDLENGRRQQRDLQDKDLLLLPKSSISR
jgi:hypothetical protein